jgi:hypothetical protein
MLLSLFHSPTGAEGTPQHPGLLPSALRKNRKAAVPEHRPSLSRRSRTTFASRVLAVPLWFTIVCVASAGGASLPDSLDTPPTLTIDDARVEEGDAGFSHLLFVVRLSGPPHRLATVHYTAVEGSATVADGDFEPTDGVLTLATTDTAGTIDVPVHGDTRLEGNEWLLVRLSDPVGLVVADSEAVGTIDNDERATFTVLNPGFSLYFGGTLPNAWGDYDGDGYPDLPLFHATGDGTFTEIPGFRALLNGGNFHGAAWADYDRDGDLDMALLGYALPGRAPTPNHLFRNQGDGTFVDVAPANGMDVAGNGETVVWGDFDGDGWPDLFVPNYAHVFPFRSLLYRNNGDGTFTERAVEAGVALAGTPIGLRPEGAQAVDWDDDGHLDLYCASHLFLNDGTGHFTDVREAVGLPILFDEGASMIDYDNDGDFDLYLRSDDGPRLFRNDHGHFTDATEASELEPITGSWGDAWTDVEGDGDLDLLVIGGDGHAHLMLNRGDDTFERDTLFERLAVPAGLAAWADYDHDGDVDIAITTGYGRVICRNEAQSIPGARESQLSVRVLDGEGHETCHGATVSLRQLGAPPGFVQTRVVDGGSGYLGQSEYTVRFGGVGSGRYALQVVYPSPSGMRVVVDSLVSPLLSNVEALPNDQHRFIVRSDGSVEETPVPVAGVAPPSSPRSTARFLSAPYPTPARHEVSFAVRVERAARIALRVQDVHGRRVREMGAVEAPGGPLTLRWDLTDDRGAPVATGIYFCQLVVDGQPVDARRALVLH